VYRCASSRCSSRRAWRYRSRRDCGFTVGSSFKYAHTPSDPGTVLATTSPTAQGTSLRSGRARGSSSTRATTRFAPARGRACEHRRQWHPAVWDAVHQFASVSAEASTYVSAGDPPSATLALRAGAGAVSGTAPFQELIYVGGGTTVRGLRRAAVRRRRVAYGNTELRILAGRLPFGDIGILGLSTRDVSGFRGVVGPLARRRGGGLWLTWQHRRANYPVDRGREEP